MPNIHLRRRLAGFRERAPACALDESVTGMISMLRMPRPRPEVRPLVSTGGLPEAHPGAASSAALPFSECDCRRRGGNGAPQRSLCAREFGR